MAKISSLTSYPKLEICKKRCKSCGLNLFQEPIFEPAKISTTFWVGLSAIKFDEKTEKLPLSLSTPSGALIHNIEYPFRDKHTFYKTNLVKCPPMTSNKLRYPSEKEMEKCFPNLQWELQNLHPTTVFLLGKQVATFVLKKLSTQKPFFNDSFDYQSFRIENINFVPIHHPSYVLVYKRKNLAQYIEKVSTHILRGAISARMCHTAYLSRI